MVRAMGVLLGRGVVAEPEFPWSLGVGGSKGPNSHVLGLRIVGL